MSDIELDKQRDAVIEEIRKAFPIKPLPKKWVHKQSTMFWEPESVLKEVKDKHWTEITDSSFAYSFNDVDFLSILHPEAFIYFLPTFLVLTTLSPWDIVSTTVFSQIKHIDTKLSIDQLKSLISYLSYQEHYLHEEGVDIHTLNSVEDLLLRLLFLLDEKQPKA